MTCCSKKASFASVSSQPLRTNYGIDPALQLPDTTLILFPLTMISKRIKTGQDVDIYELYDGSKEKVNEIKYNAQ